MRADGTPGTPADSPCCLMAARPSSSTPRTPTAVTAEGIRLGSTDVDLIKAYGGRRARRCSPPPAGPRWDGCVTGWSCLSRAVRVISPPWQSYPMVSPARPAGRYRRGGVGVGGPPPPPRELGGGPRGGNHST